MGAVDVLSEHVYCVATAFKMTEQVEQWICIKFCIKLEHFFAETIWMTQKDTAMGNWWLAASSWQCACSYITSCAELFGETSDHSGDSAPLQLRFGTLWLLALSKTKVTFEREDFSQSMRFRKIRCCSWWQPKELCEVPRCLLWRGLRHHRPMYNVSCILYLLQLMSLFFVLVGWISSRQTSFR